MNKEYYYHQEPNILNVLILLTSLSVFLNLELFFVHSGQIIALSLIFFFFILPQTIRYKFKTNSEIVNSKIQNNNKVNEYIASLINNNISFKIYEENKKLLNKKTIKPLVINKKRNVPFFREEKKYYYLVLNIYYTLAIFLIFILFFLQIIY